MKVTAELSREFVRGPGRGARWPQPTPGLHLDRSDRLLRAFMLAATMMRRYHRYELLYPERVIRPLDAGRRVIIVGNHAFNIIDPFVFVATLFRLCGRVPRFMGHARGWFHVPVLRRISARWELVPSRDPERAAAALERDGFLMLFPGGNSESGLRSYRREPYRLKWADRKGFLRLALQHDAELVFAAAVGNDEAYYQSRVPMPRRILELTFPGVGERYAGMRVFFGLLGAQLIPGIFPLPVKLMHVVSKPIDLGDRRRALADASAFDALHARVWTQCQELLDTAVASRDRYSDRLDRWVRGGEALLQRLGL